MNSRSDTAVLGAHPPIELPGSSVHQLADLKGQALSCTDEKLHDLLTLEKVLTRVDAKIKSLPQVVTRRLVDVFLSLLALPVLVAAIALIGIAIWIDSKGPVIIAQRRMGKNRKLFNCLKFRTMYTNADEILEGYLAKNTKAAQEWRMYKKLKSFDPRVTRVGNFLRKTSLDELPQIFNILKGEMSIFGPRPYLACEAGDMNGYRDLILMIPPGVTGLWQVSGRNSLTFNDRLKLDVFYVLNWSLWLDVEIFFRTIKVVLKREGAY